MSIPASRGLGRRLLAAIAALLALCARAEPAAAQNMIGRQSQNEGLLVLPAPGKVLVDGKLDDWDLTGRIWVFADRSLRSRYSAEASAMWDRDSLYVAVRWRDPTPMHNLVDPEFDPASGWKGDSLQLRVRTPQRTSWLTLWYFTAKKMPVLHVAHWKDQANARAGQEEVLLKAAPGGTDLGRGAEMACRKDADGKGYVQEIKLPWATIFKERPKIEPNLTFRCGMEFLWGDPTGKTWPVHRYADNMQPGVTSREFYWTNWKAWGDAKLAAAGRVPVRQYRNFRYAADRTVNRRIHAVPAPGKVVLDGKLDEWDRSGGILTCMDVNRLLDAYSAWFYMMYDRQGLFVAARVTDQTPMRNGFDPALEPLICHRGDTVFLRFQSGGRCTTLFVYHWSAKGRPAVVLAEGKRWQETRKFHDGIARGVRAVLRKLDDGKGYVAEVRIPWSVLTGGTPAPGPGDVLPATVGTYWGGMHPKSHFAYNYFDLVGEGQPLPTANWWHTDAWGQVVLSPKGDLSLPTPLWLRKVSAGGQALLAGTIPVRASIPAKAARFTIAVNDRRGRRVRNLAGDFDPDLYAVETNRERRVVEVLWDGLDDWGRLVPPGAYQLVGLTHEGLGAEYDMTYYNPGTPPWTTADTSGAWGSNHADPSLAAAAGRNVIVGWFFSEGGSALVGVGPDGRKKWGELRGARRLAADERHVYTILGRPGVQADLPKQEADILNRFSAADGSYQPFRLKGKSRFFDLPVSEVFAGKAPGRVTGMAAHAGTLALALSGGKIALLDAESAELRKLLDATAPTALAFGPDGALYALLAGKPHRVDLRSGAAAPIPTPGLVAPVDLDVDRDGNLVFADAGPDSQVKAYSPAGKLLYTCGRKGGRPVRGRFDEQAMAHVSSVAVDAQGRVWVTENWQYPRRVSVWGRDGKLVRDYVGNTRYASMGCHLHESDPTIAYVGPIKLLLDRRAASWKVAEILWVPDAGRGERFGIDLGSAHCQRFWSDAGGRRREYLYDPPYGVNEGHVLFMKRRAGWQPVALVGLVGHVSGRIQRYPEKVLAQPAGEFDGLNVYDGCFWNDRNKDGKVQRSECTIVPVDPKQRWRPRGIPQGSGWGGRIGRDLVFYTAGLTRYRPIGFDDEGAPKYGPAGMGRFGPEDQGDLVPVPEENLLLCLSWKGYADRTTGMLGIDTRSGEVLWSYPNPYPGVHGSHRAPMPGAGLLIGPLKICGVAEVNQRVGRVFALRGNLGQDYYLTTDGLYVGAMFRDCRLPTVSLPAREEMLRGMPMEGFSEGSEPFSGWFGRQADGKVRMLTSIARCAGMIVEIRGLETIRRFRGPTITLDTAALAKAELDNAARAAAAAKPRSCRVARAPRPPKIDGDASDWPAGKGVEVARAGSPERAAVRLIYDDRHLYAFYDVTDASPWRNAGKDGVRLFKTGDAVDLQINVSGRVPGPQRRRPSAGDVRVLIAPLASRPAAVLMRPVDPAAPKQLARSYVSPVGTRRFDRVEVLRDAQVRVRVRKGGYRVEAAIPLAAIGLKPAGGMVTSGDVGFISSDEKGTVNTARTYWSNRHTNLVSDEPQESWLYPATWGRLTFE